MKFKNILIIFFIAFILNFIWEFFQMPLYDVPWEIWSGACISACFFSTLWDATYVVLIYLLLAFLNKDFYWIKDWNRKDIFIILFVGFATAIFVEVRALGMGDWAYGPNMPLLPLGVGLTPALQLPLLSFISFIIFKKLNTR